MNGVSHAFGGYNSVGYRSKSNVRSTNEITITRYECLKYIERLFRPEA